MFPGSFLVRLGESLPDRRVWEPIVAQVLPQTAEAETGIFDGKEQHEDKIPVSRFYFMWLMGV